MKTLRAMAFVPHAFFVPRSAAPEGLLFGACFSESSYTPLNLPFFLIWQLFFKPEYSNL
jgi:hypothetical protein